MIRWGTMVRVQGEKGIWLVHDFDLNLSGNLSNPSCVQSVELFEPALSYEARADVSLGSDFFALRPGDTTLVVTGASSFEVSFTER